MIYDFTYTKCLEEKRSVRTESRFIVAWGSGREWGLTINEHLSEVMKMFQMFKKLDCDYGCITQ